MPLVFHKRSALQLSKFLLTKKQYLVVKELVIIYSYFRYVKFIGKIGKRCVTSISKAYQTKVNSKMISICRRQRERYLKKLQKNNIPGFGKRAETSLSKNNRQCFTYFRLETRFS